MKKIQSRKWEIDNVNFDHFMNDLLKTMTDGQRANLPMELAFKLDKGAKYAVSMLTFTQKLYILSIAFNKKVTLIIEDDKGLLPADFLPSIIKAQNGKKKTGELVDEFRAAGAFFLGSHDLMNWLEYANMICATPMYRLMTGFRSDIKDRSKVQQRAQRVRESVNGILEMLVYYEGNKKRMSTDYNVGPAEWYALMFFYRGENTPDKFYDEAFKYAYTSNRRTLSVALTSLKRRGFLDTRGAVRSTRYHITPKGKELTIKIMERITFGY
jgi:hypothetical protein